MSRRDDAIVAWHEVPGRTPPQKIRPVGYGLILAGVRTNRSRRLWPYMDGIAKQNGTFPKCLGSVSDHLHLCLSQLQENGTSIEQQLEQQRTRTFQEEYLAFLKKRGSHFDEKYLWDQLRPIIPYPTGRFFRGTLSPALRAWLRSACPSGTKRH